MKRSGLPPRRTPLPRAAKPMKRTAMVNKPRRPLPRESTRRKAERPTRVAVRIEALRRAGYHCQLKDIVPEVECWGPLDVDEIAQRGVAPGGHLDPDNVQVCCRGHHDWKGTYREEAEKRGVRMSGAEYERRNNAT